MNNLMLDELVKMLITKNKQKKNSKSSFVKLYLERKRKKEISKRLWKKFLLSVHLLISQLKLYN